MVTEIGGQDLDEVKDTMIEAIIEAGSILMDNFGEDMIVSTKGPGDVVTNVDKMVSDFLSRRFKAKFPGYGFLDEEREEDGRFSHDFCIVTDPLDGTKEYIEGSHGFCVLGGLLYQLEPILGIAYHPIIKETVYAIRGEGAYSFRGEEKPKPIKVSSSEDIRLLLTRSHNSPALDEIINKKLKWKSLGRMGGLWKVIEIAKGEATAYINPPPSKVHIWDLCAPSVILEEAGEKEGTEKTGGKITDIYGRALNFGQEDTMFTDGILATNGVIHDSLLDKLGYRPRDEND